MPLFSVDDGFSGSGQRPGDVGAQRVEALDETDVAVALEAQPGGEGEVAATALAGHDDPIGVDAQRGVVGRDPPQTRHAVVQPGGIGGDLFDGRGRRAALRKSTIATATPWAAMILPQAR